MADTEVQLEKPEEDLQESVNSRTPLNDEDTIDEADPNNDNAYKIEIQDDENSTTNKNTKELSEPLMTPSTHQIIDSHTEDETNAPSTPPEHSQSIESMTNPLEATKL